MFVPSNRKKLVWNAKVELDPKYKLVQWEGPLYVCVMDVKLNASNVKVVGGNSGGGLIDDSGNLVGIASAGDEESFSYWVRLSDIRDFLKPY